MIFKYGGREVELIGAEFRIIFNGSDLKIKLSHDLRLLYVMCNDTEHSYGRMLTANMLTDYARDEGMRTRDKHLQNVIECCQMAGLIPSDHLALPVFDITKIEKLLTSRDLGKKKLPSILERTI